MKKLLITAAAVLATLNMFAQGTVNLANNSATAVYVDSVGGTTKAGNTYSAGLYYAPDGTTDESLFTLLAPSAAVIGSGIYNAGARTAPITTPGGMGMFQVRVWTTSLGQTYEDAYLAGLAGGNGKMGKSNLVRVDTGDPTTVPPGTPGSLAASGLAPMAVTTVPEPSVIGLGILGIGTLLLLRRRK
jgi:hypothetical protein